MSKDSNVFQQFGSRRRAALRPASGHTAAQVPEPAPDTADWQSADMQSADMQSADMQSADTPQAAQHITPTEKQSYRAAHIDKSNKQASLEMYFADGKTLRMLAWSLFTGAVSATPKHFTIFFSEEAITIKGRNLWQLTEGVRDHRLQTLTAFQPKKHLPPEEPDALYIEEIIYEDTQTARAGLKPKS